MNNKKNFGGLAIFTAIAASLCCITPLLAFVAGLGGLASSFQWLEPLRPYLIGSTVLVLAFAWYQSLQPKKDIDCDCDDENPPFLQTKKFLGIVTVFAVLMLTFPYYTQIFYPTSQSNEIQLSSEHLETREFNITGMTCTGCEQHIIHAVDDLNGITFVDASYEKGIAIVQFDTSQIKIENIIQSINGTGYTVTK